mgnify:CR=1 FL=1
MIAGLRLVFSSSLLPKSREKRREAHYLVQAHTLPQAVKYIEEVMGKTMVDYVISNVAETKIMDVFEHEAKDSLNTPDARPEYEEQPNA